MMVTSETTTALFSALAKFQAECHGAARGGTNPHLHNTYARLEDAWAAARVPLTRHGLSLVQMPCEAPKGSVGLSTRVCHSSGEWIEATQHMPVVAGKGVTDAQAVGSSLSYARRYGFLAALGLPSIDDDGEGGRGVPAATNAAAGPDETENVVRGAIAAINACSDKKTLEALVTEMKSLPDVVKARLLVPYQLAVKRVAS